jgi:hypothetical protein
MAGLLTDMIGGIMTPAEPQTGTIKLDMPDLNLAPLQQKAEQVAAQQAQDDKLAKGITGAVQAFGSKMAQQAPMQTYHPPQVNMSVPSFAPVQVPPMGAPMQLPPLGAPPVPPPIAPPAVAMSDIRRKFKIKSASYDMNEILNKVYDSITKRNNDGNR